MNIRLTAALSSFCLVSLVASAKLPAPNEEAKAKAEEAKTKAAEAAAKEAEALGKSQDLVAAKYIKAQKAKGIAVKPTPMPAPTAK